MSPATINYEIYTALMSSLVLSGPIMGAAAAVGLLLGIIQAATQIQDQALPQIAKIFTVSAMLMIFGSVLTVPLYQHASRLFETFPTMVR